MNTDSTKAKIIPCQTSDNVQDELNRLHETEMRPWREIAKMPEFSGIPAGTLCSIAKGEKIPEKYKAQLGIPHSELVPVCPEHQIAHRYDCQRQTVHVKRAGSRTWRSLWDIPKTELLAMLKHRQDI